MPDQVDDPPRREERLVDGQVDAAVPRVDVDGVAVVVAAAPVVLLPLALLALLPFVSLLPLVGLVDVLLVRGLRGGQRGLDLGLVRAVGPGLAAARAG